MATDKNKTTEPIENPDNTKKDDSNELPVQNPFNKTI